MATAKKAAAKKPSVKAAAKVSKATTAAPAVKKAVNPVAAWPFPTGTRP